MEDNIQTIIIALISTFLLFIFPVYMAYEKKDDVSYALAIRYTQTLVDEVRSKGYITYDMYTEYSNKLRNTGNSYDVQMTHTYSRYDPVTNYYKKENGNLVIAKTTTQEERKTLIEELVSSGVIPNNNKAAIQNYDKSQGYEKVEDTYIAQNQVFGSKHILNILQKEQDNLNKDGISISAYTMNVDDNFNITIKNTNTTLATVIYNMVTIKGADVNTRIYVNYGGVILNSKWYDNREYAKSIHDSISIATREKELIFAEERGYTTEVRPTKEASKVYEGNWGLEFNAYPETTTELRDMGGLSKFSGFNFAVGNNDDEILSNKSAMSVSVGINGVSVIAEGRNLEAYSSSNYAFPVETGVTQIPQYEVNIYGESILVGYIDQPWSYQTRASDYTSIRLRIVGQQVRVYLNGNQKGSIPVDYNMAQWLQSVGFDKTYIAEPQIDTISLGTTPNGKSTFSATIVIQEDSISISAKKDTYKVLTLLSYPVKINEYTKIRVEIKNSIPILYIDDIKVMEGIAANNLYIKNVGSSKVLGSEYYYLGKLKNVLTYDLED